MAWLDDRFWAHPKVAGLSDRAYRAFVNSICYSSGMSTRGHLNDAQIKLIGAKNREKTELISQGLWLKTTRGIAIHDWDDHNEKRDAKRAADRERKRLARAKERAERLAASAGQGADSPPDSPQDAEEAVRWTRNGHGADETYADGVTGDGVTETSKPPNPNPAVDAARLIRDLPA
jgi:hypothetical protein